MNNGLTNFDPQKLIQLRTEHGWEQQDVASRARVSTAAVCRWENGVCKPRREAVKTLAKIFRVKMENLLLEEIKESEVQA